MYNKDKPYNDLPLLPPDVEIESAPILKKAIKANKALARLTGSAGRLPNESVLISSILLQESKMSSEIENIVTTNDDLYKAISLDAFAGNSPTKEVLHYNEALWYGTSEIKAKGFLSTNLFIRLCQIIKKNQTGIRKQTGTQIKNATTGNTVYTPPEGEEVIQSLLKNLEDFLNDDSDDIDPLIKMAIAHYQFEAIHPFNDGNGRTGRIINILYLLSQDLLQLPLLYLSSYIIHHKEGYYSGLRAVNEKGAWIEWIMYMLTAVEETALLTQRRIEEILLAMEQTGEELKKKLPEIYSKELLELIFSQPYCKRKFLVDAGHVGLKTAGQYLMKLEEAGFLQSVRAGKEKLYINERLYKLLQG